MGHFKKSDIRMYRNIAVKLSKISKAKRRKVGCIIVDNNAIISSGVNGTFPRDSNVIEKHGKTLPHVIHAEMNAILKLIKRGYNLSPHAAIFTTLSPCIECAKLIRLIGINYVFYNDKYRKNLGLRYLKNSNIKVNENI